MHALDQGDAAVAVGARVLRRAAVAGDEIENQNGRAGVKNFWRNPGLARRPRRREFIEAHDAMHENIAAKPHDGAALSTVTR
jgi:hypothetical protein